MLLVLTALDASYATALNRGSADCVLLYPFDPMPDTTGRAVQQRTMLAEQIDSLRTTEEQRRP
jgi:hypothetical protein